MDQCLYVGSKGHHKDKGKTLWGEYIQSILQASMKCHNEIQYFIQLVRANFFLKKKCLCQIGIWRQNGFGEVLHEEQTCSQW